MASIAHNVDRSQCSHGERLGASGGTFWLKPGSRSLTTGATGGEVVAVRPWWSMSLPKHVAGWLVVLPIVLTIVLAWVPLEIFAMVRFWRAIPLGQRPHSLDLLPEFKGITGLQVAVCLIGLLGATGMNAAVWLTWAQAS